MALVFFLSLLPSLSYGEISKIKIKKLEYGTSFAGKELIAYKIFQEGNFSRRLVALLTDGIHGNEYTGVGDDFIKAFTKNKNEWGSGLKGFFKDGGVFLIVPRVNPDGVKKGSRYSSLGSDLNRDFNRIEDKPFFSQQETFYLDQFVRNELSQKNQLVLAVDYHCCAKSLLYPPNFSGKTDKFLEGLYSKMFSSLKEHLGPHYVMKSTKEVFGQTFEGTMKDYWFKEFGTISFTFEGYNPKHDPLQSKKHLEWWDSMLSDISSLSHQTLTYLQEIPELKREKKHDLSSKNLKYSE